MNIKKLISVIIPTYNRGVLISKSLQSVFEQSYRPIEVIIIDDGSTDNTYEIVNDYIDKYSSEKFNIVYKKQSNNGAPSARNEGLNLARGEYIQYLDSDDYLLKEKFSRQIEGFKKNFADIVTCDYERIYVDSSKEYYSNKNPYNKIIHGGSLTIFAPLIKSTIAKKVRWDEFLKRNQDVDYMLKVFLLSENVHHIHESYCVYVQHNSIRVRDNCIIQSNTYFHRANNIIRFFNTHRSNIKRRVIPDLFIILYSLIKNGCKVSLKILIKKTR